MAWRLPAMLFACGLAFSGGVFAADDWAQRDIKVAQAFQKALKANDHAAVARLVGVPLNLDFPLPPIKTTGEFLAHWNEFFDKSDTAELLRDAPREVGWQGVMIGNGLIWFSNGRASSLNARTDVYQKRWDEAKSREAATLYPSLRGYQKVDVTCFTKTKHVRIQQHADGYHYFVWPKAASTSQKPELELKGEMQFEGSGGNRAYTFENNGFSYVFQKVFICGENCDDTLTVSKGGTEISSQACK